MWANGRIVEATSRVAPNAWRRHLYLMMDAFRAANRHELPEPPLTDDQLYQANQSIKVPPLQQQLQIDITPDKQVFQPQQTAGYEVFARDWQGNCSQHGSGACSESRAVLAGASVLMASG